MCKEKYVYIRICIIICLYHFFHAGNKQEPLPWWDGGDCRCHGNTCLPKQVRNLSWEDAGGACGRRAWLAGGGQKVISFALFGNKSQYWRAFGKNLNAVSVWKIKPRCDYTDIYVCVQDRKVILPQTKKCQK